MPSTSYDIGKTNRRHFGVPTPVTRVWLTGRVGELSDSVMSINGTACGAVITLDGVSYRYHGTEPAAIQESPSDTFVNALELRLRNGDTFVMAEVRTASSPGRQSQQSHIRLVRWPRGVVNNR